MRVGAPAPVPLDLAGKVAVVTGAARGIGEATAERLYARGARLALLDRDENALDSLAARLDRDRCHALACDVRDPDGVAGAVHAVVRRWQVIDVVVANAGITPPPATLRSIDPDALSRVIDVNLLGVWHTVRATVDHVIARHGHITIISSCAAFTPGMGGAAYMMSKAAVEQLGRALRIELAIHATTAGVVSLGIVDTALARRTLDDDELGRAVGRLLPWPLNRRISAEDAAEVICRSIEHRRARRIAPRTWIPYAALRGLVNPVLDDVLAANPRLHAILRRLDQRVAGTYDTAGSGTTRHGDC
ncbi:MAG TPA: SDR family oxidoreductase [Rugosimonospora sp.]|nr:SDR family oxidoreductase [Rugosimonospora sp.]